MAKKKASREQEAKASDEGGNGTGAQAKAQAPILAAAERLMQRRGWQLILISLFHDGNGVLQKKPLVASFANTGVRWGATAHLDVLRADYARFVHQHSNIGLGIPLGVDNNIFALELDTPAGHAGRDDPAYLQTLEQQHGELPTTLCARTPTGSLHFYFKLPRGYGVEFRLKSKLGPIEVKGEGHYLVAPPTLRPGYDVPYRWIDEDAAIAEAPEWLLDLLTVPITVDEGGGECEDAVGPDLVAATVACIPNNDAEYDDWIATGMGIKACVADEEIAFAIWYAWSDQSEKNNKERNTAAVWKTLKPTRSGYGALVNRARKAHPDWENRMFYLEDELAQHIVRFTTTALGVIESGKPPNWLKEDAGRGVGCKGKWEAPAPEDDQPMPEDDQPGTDEQPLVLILELARKLWGAGQKISMGQWRFGANNEIAVDAFRASWFNLATGAEGGLKELKRMAASLYAGSAQDTSSVVLVRATDVVPRAKKWLWEGHLLRGALELLTGVPGLWKSQVQCSYVACVTKGGGWPCGGKGLGEPMSVIMVTAEDPLDQEVVPRLIAAGADLSRVHFLQYIKTDEKQRQFLLSEDLDRIEKAVARIGDVGLITMDPITAYMGGKVDSHKVTEVRSQLGPLKDFSQKLQTAVSAVTHPAKNPGRRAIDHFIASQAFIAAARIGHACFMEMKQDETTGENKPTGRVLFTHAKHNPSEAMRTLAYRIIGGIAIGQDQETRAVITSSHAVWEQAPVDISPDAAVAAGEHKSKREGEQAEVQRFLRNMLGGGLVLQQEIMDEGKRLGFSGKQIRTAARKLNVIMKKSSFEGPWQWVLPM